MAAGLALVALAGCSGVDDEEAGRAAATDAPAATYAATEGTVAGGAVTAAGSAEAPASGDSAQSAGGGVIAPVAAQVPGQALAITASASVQADDVRAAVDQLTTLVTTRGGHVAAADIDYDPGPAGDETGAEPDAVDTSRANLVLAIPPAELPAMENALQEIGTVTSFDQLAEDVAEQLADLDSRILNLRASVERVRALLAEATDIEGIVLLEAELTSRETQLEQLLAQQRQLDDRVAMSTLTVAITTTPALVEAAEGADDPGVADALAAGWNAFTSGLFRVVLVLSAIAPFVGAAVVLVALGFAVRRAILKRQPPAQPPAVP